MVKTKLTTTIPPKRGPLPQGLNIKYNTDKGIPSEKKYGNRQKSTKQNQKRS
jgi:hypothetical protein